MTQTICDRLCEYSDFRATVRKPRRTERAQRQEIETSLARLAEQGDFWSLDLIRKAATALTEDTPAAQSLYFLLHDVIFSKPGDFIIRYREH